MSSDALIEKLVDSPRLGLYVDRLQEVLNCERGKREQFYQSMSEGTKQEFINGEVVVHSPVKLPVRALFDQQQNLKAIQAILAG